MQSLCKRRKSTFFYVTTKAEKICLTPVFILCPGCPGVHDSEADFRIAKFYRKVGRSSQYVGLPTIPNPKPLLKHVVTKVSQI